MSDTNYWTRMKQRRMSRRAILRASARAGVGATGLALVGCGDDDDDDAAVTQAQTQTQPQAEPQAQTQAQADTQAQQAAQQEAPEEEQAVAQAQAAPVRGGTLRFSTPAATHDYFDPHRAVFGPTQFWMGFYQNYLVRWRNKEQAVMEADVASLPEIPDEETYVFSLDQGAKYWDQFPTEGGREVTAEDIRINFQRQIDAVDDAGQADGTFLGASGFQQTASMDVPDAQTFVAKTDGANATYLSSVILRPFSWITSPEAIEEFGDRWRDESTNVALSSGTGMFIPQSYDPEIGISMIKNPNYWKVGADGQPLPYYDAVNFSNLTDPTAVEAAYRGKQIDAGGFPLSKLQVDGIQADFPEHTFSQVAFGFTIITNWANFNPDWDGEDGQGNPWLDRRFAYAMQIAVDRQLMIDTVYLGDARLSANQYAPWYNEFWKIPDAELQTIPGYRADRQQDIDEARQLLDASGFDTSRTLTILTPDIWEGTYPGIVDTMTTMYNDALGINVNFEVQPYTIILQRLVDGSYPGSGPQWTNPPSDLDPTNGWVQGLLPGASTNLLRYDYQPVTDIVNEMKVTLDAEARREMSLKVQRIGMGIDPEHGLDGIFASFAVMNGIQRGVAWPYVHEGEDSRQFAHASHRHDDTWLDVNHAEYPA